MNVKPQQLSLTRHQARAFAIAFSPLYAEMFADLVESGARFLLQDRFALIRHRVGGYVRLYESDAHIGVAALMGLFGEDEFRCFNEESKSWSSDDKLAFMESVLDQATVQGLIDDLEIPQTEEEWVLAESAAKSMSEDELNRSARRGALFFGSVFAQLLNVFSLMAHGSKLTSLVARAARGDDDAFVKAVQVDRVLLVHHPYFVLRKAAAQNSNEPGEIGFLQKLSKHELKPELRGRIRYPGLYFLFHALESVGWLERLTDKELLDICDDAGLDRWQNRIEDVNYLTKRRREYLQWQKAGAVSMH